MRITAMNTVLMLSLLTGLAQIGIAQKEIPMSSEIGNVVLIVDDIHTHQIAGTTVGSILEGSIRNETPFALAMLEFQVLGLTPRISIRTTIGFTAKQDRMSFGVLGQLGFFSEVNQVHFHHGAGWFGIDTAAPVAVGKKA